MAKGSLRQAREGRSTCTEASRSAPRGKRSPKVGGRPTLVTAGCVVPVLNCHWRCLSAATTSLEGSAFAPRARRMWPSPSLQWSFPPKASLKKGIERRRRRPTSAAAAAGEGRRTTALLKGRRRPRAPHIRPSTPPSYPSSPPIVRFLLSSRRSASRYSRAYVWAWVTWVRAWAFPSLPVCRVTAGWFV